SRRPPRVERRVSGVPEEICEICYRLLDKDASLRPSIEEVRAALGVKKEKTLERHPSGDGQSDQPFVGREREQRALEACITKALEGKPSVALVSGESGIGKSTLASVVSRSAQRLGFLCVRGRCYEREKLPFVALDRAMDALIVILSNWPKERLEGAYNAIEDL